MNEAVVRLQVRSPEAMVELGTRLAGVLRAGDLVLLSGPLGAGKTTLVRGIGAAMGVRGAVTSPTYVIARTHPSQEGGPGLVHVDAYRLHGLAELDDLDLDTDLVSAVMVVEWGTGVAEPLAAAWLEVRITRSDTDETRDVDLLARGDGWPEHRLADLVAIERPASDVESRAARPPSS